MWSVRTAHVACYWNFFLVHYMQVLCQCRFCKEGQRLLQVQVQVTLRLTVSQSVSLGVEPHLGLMTRYSLLLWQLRSCFVGRPLWRENASTTPEILDLVIQSRCGPHRKRLLHYCVLSRCWGIYVSTELFPSNGSCTVACLHSCYVEMDLHVAV
jgi:hypothetical protein